MKLWKPDTCFCIILCEAPSINGTFVKPCELHKNTRNTTDVYVHNVANRTRPNEITGTDKNATVDLTRKIALQESTRRKNG